MPDTCRFKQALGIAVFSAGLLTLTACSDGGSSSRNNLVDSSDDSGTTVSFSGDAAKGIIVNGVVSVYPIVDGSVDTESALGTTTTGATGSYTVELEDYDGSPVTIEITSATDGSTSMKCDLAAGCGNGVAFGDLLTLDDFSVTAVVTEITDNTTTVSVTPLSTVAAEVALDALASGSETDIATAINNANTSVANRFGLTGDITQLAIIDVTDPEAVAAADSAALQFNLYNAAVVQSVLSDDGTISIADAVQSFATQFVTNGGLADTETAGAVGITLADIFNGASSIIDSIQDEIEAAGLTTVDLSGLATDIDALASLTENGSTTPTSGTPTAVDDDDTELDIVKSEVAMLRTLAYGIDLTSADTFAGSIETAAATVDADLALALEAMSYAAQAIGDAWVLASESDLIPATFTDTDTGIEVAIANSNTSLTFTVDQEVTVMSDTGVSHTVDVSISATDNGSSASESEPVMTENADGSYSETIEFLANIDLVIEGEATVEDSVSVAVESGNFTAVMTGEEGYLAQYIVENSDGSMSYGFTEDGVLQVEDFSLALDAMVTQLSGDDPITFDGNIALDVSSATESYEYQALDHTGDTYLGFTEMWTDNQTLGEVSLTVSGSFSSLSGNSMIASLSVSANGTGFEYTCESSFNFSAITGEYTYEDVCADETDEAYVPMSASLALLMDVDSLENSVTLTLALERTSPVDGVLVVRLMSGAYTYSATYTTGTTGLETIEIVTASGAVISLSESASTTSVTGSITLNGTEYATIEENASGIVVITYSDGEFESL